MPDLGDREKFHRIYILVLVVVISAVFLQMIRVFIVTVPMAAIFSGLTQPLYRRLLKLVRGRRATASVLTLLVVLVVVVTPLVWGTLMAALSIVPALGAAVVWGPAVLYLFAVGKTVSAIGLALWCALVVGTVDNFLRPKLVGRDTKMPDLLILLSTFGGLSMFGAVGFVLGPIIAALFIAVWQIYGAAFGDLLGHEPPAEDEAPAQSPPLG